MATLYPIYIGDPPKQLKFYANPTKLDVHKQSQISQVRTMGGTTFQVWPDLPDVISFSGMTWGTRAISELRGLAQQIEKSPTEKLTSLTYKNKKYNGYMQELKIRADADRPRQYTYDFNFISMTRFKIDTMPIGNMDSISAEFDFMAGQLRTATDALINTPIEAVASSKAVFAQISGQSGSQQQGLGMFIGRPRGII